MKKHNEKALVKLEEIEKIINKERQQKLQTLLPFRGRLIMNVCNVLFRILKPVNLEIMYIQVPPRADKNEFIADFMKKVSTPLEMRVKREDPPTCCENHILEYMRKNNCCPIHDDDMNFYFKLCIEEGMYEQADIIKLEAQRRGVKLNKV